MSPYTLIIGTRNWSSWSLRPYMALRATGQPFEIVLVHLRLAESSDNIRQFSPTGKVPALTITEDGKSYTVCDSLAICETIAERHPEALLLPDAPEARAMARSYAAEMHSGFPDLRDQLSMFYAQTLPLPELRPETEKQIVRIIAAWEQALQTYGDISAGDGGGFLFGRFSIADCMYAPVVSRFRTYGVAVPSNVQAYCDRMWALPAMQEWLSASEKEVADGLAWDVPPSP